jgi:hypothetical protein
MLEDDYFGGMCNVYSELQPLRQCRKSLNNLSRFETVLGADGFNRSTLWMFGTVTSRNNPRSRDFLLSRPHWVRNLIAAPPQALPMSPTYPVCTCVIGPLWLLWDDQSALPLPATKLIELSDVGWYLAWYPYAPKEFSLRLRISKTFQRPGS